MSATIFSPLSAGAFGDEGMSSPDSSMGSTSGHDLLHPKPHHPREEADDEADEEEEEQQTYAPGNSTVNQASFNFVNSIIGAGIVGMPFAIKQCGLAMGVCLIVLVAWLVIVSVQMLIATGVKHNKLDFEDLARHLLGPRGFILTLVFMFLFAYGSMIAYLIVIGDSIPAVAAAISPSLQPSRSSVIAFSAVFIVLPICCLQDLSALSTTSLVSIAADVMLVLIVLVGAPASAAAQGTHQPLSSLPLFSANLFIGLGTLSFAFVCMHNSFLVFRSLREPTVDNWNRVATRSVVFSMIMCLLFGLSGYLSFGSSCRGDVLLNFAQDDPAVNVARVFLALSMTLTYPQECFVARHCVLQLLLELGLTSRPAALAAAGAGAGAGAGGMVGGMVGSAGGTDESTHGEEERDEGAAAAFGVGAGGVGFAGYAAGSGAKMKTAAPSLTINQHTSSSGSRGSSSRGSSSGSSSSSSSDIVDEMENRSWAKCVSDCARELAVTMQQGRVFYLVTLVLWGASTLVAIAFTDLGVVLSLTGAVGASILGYVLPPTLYLVSSKAEMMLRLSQQSKHETFAAKVHGWLSLSYAYCGPVCLAAFGCLSMVLGVVGVFVHVSRRR